MPREDAIRWNKRYSASAEGWFEKPRSFLIENQDLLPKSGWVLDLAMGPGVNADYLVRRGMNVLGIDISDVAVHLALQRNPKIHGIVADLSQFPLPDRKFDMVMNFYYLQRDIWPFFKQLLKPGGLLIIETLTIPMRNVRSDIEPEFLLGENELRDSFSDWEIIQYREGWFPSDHGNEKAIASMIARLPG